MTQSCVADICRNSRITKTTTITSPNTTINPASARHGECVPSSALDPVGLTHLNSNHLMRRRHVLLRLDHIRSPGSPSRRNHRTPQMDGHPAPGPAASALATDHAANSRASQARLLPSAPTAADSIAVAGSPHGEGRGDANLASTSSPYHTSQIHHSGAISHMPDHRQVVLPDKRVEPDRACLLLSRLRICR